MVILTKEDYQKYIDIIESLQQVILYLLEEMESYDLKLGEKQQVSYNKMMKQITATILYSRDQIKDYPGDENEKDNIDIIECIPFNKQPD